MKSINWISVDNDLPKPTISETMSERILLWVVFNGEDLDEGRAEPGVYFFINKRFYTTDNAITKRLDKGTAKVTHYSLINVPE